MTSTHCHKMVAKVAQEAAGELYERLMGDDQFYSEWKRQNPEASAKTLERRFIAKNWGKCIPFARATLALMLRSGIDEGLKSEIVEALCLDATLMHGRPDNQARQMRTLNAAR